ncbi:hypothetical protein ACFLQL_02170 [Verrucomicrobiota bacterium]
MKFRFVAKMLLACLAAMLCAWPAQSSEARGQLTWPEEWVVFAPFTRDDPALTVDQLTGIPDQIPKPDGEIVKPRRMNVPRGERLDLKDCFEEQRIGNVAWIFTTLHSDTAQTATIGMGADWWFTAWLNGKEILATPEAGNPAWPPSPNDLTADVPLQAGDNILAVRVVTGRSSSLFAGGGPAEIQAARGKLGGADDPMRFNRLTPFMERMAFGLEEQAYATAEMPFEFPGADADLRAGSLVGLQKLPKRQKRLVRYHGRPQVHDIEYRRFPFEPVKLRLSKQKYPAEDLHLDILLWTTPPEDMPHTGTLDIILKDAQSKELARHTIAEVSDTGWFFSLGIPPALNGRTGQVEAVWKQDDQEIGRMSAAFSVLPPANVAPSGRIPIRILNEPGATIKNAPMTVGVPFPHGVLYDEANVRLVDKIGKEIPIQTKITGRWSRYGAIKWLLCDFTADLAGAPREFFLEYGPGIKRSQREAMAITTADAGFPNIDAGRIKVSDKGLKFNPSGNGNFQAVLAPSAMQGAFVLHENKKLFTVPADVKHEVEELGSEKAVVRRTGWYVDEKTKERFCQFVTRFVFHRDSPIVRIYHTWIFTGDGNKDRIREMGWRFDTAGSIQPDGFLTSFTNGTWVPGDRLVQFDYHTYKIDSGVTNMEGRTPGVLSAAIGGVRLLFGAKDFWQNFPSELEFTTKAFTFYNWPRHNPPATYERPVPMGQAYRLRFAHEGELLDFKLPQEYTEDPIWTTASKKGREVNWEKGRPESVNAQGIARTEEFLIYLTSTNTPREDAARVMQGLNDESLRAVADPAWMCASGAFGPIHHQDPAKYPLSERTYTELCHAPWRWNERLDFYGKWLYGDLPANSMNPRTKFVSVDRTLKKNHHGWPFNWQPYVRSGDPQMLKYAEVATRQMIDANFCHYATPDMEKENSRSKRRQGWWVTLLFPWAGGGAYAAQNMPELRGICIDSDYLWYNYYLTGFHRPRDVVRLWGAAVQLGTAKVLPGRISTSNMRSYLDMYKATFDPWFLIAVHEIADMHKQIWGGGAQPPEPLTIKTIGHFWKPADRDYYEFTGDEDHRRVALNIAATWCSPWAYGNSWNRLGVPYIEESAAAYDLTGDEYFLARAAACVDGANMAVFDGTDPDYLRGTSMRCAQGTSLELFTGWYIQHFPLAIAAFEKAGHVPDPVPNPFYQRQVGFETVKTNGAVFYRIDMQAVVFRKADTNTLRLVLDTWDHKDLEYHYRISGPDGATALEGAWPFKASQVVTLPAGTPPGIYRLSVTGLHPHINHSGAGTLMVPLTPPDVPEVMAFKRDEKGTRVGMGIFENQYWFQPPADCQSFWIEFHHPTSMDAIWNPTGERVWMEHVAGEDGLSKQRGIPVRRVIITVPPEFAGKPWRISRPGWNFGFVMDPAIPPYVSVSRRKWFNPE